jgi:hypothetical protein
VASFSKSSLQLFLVSRLLPVKWAAAVTLHAMVKSLFVGAFPIFCLADIPVTLGHYVILG